MVNEDTKYEKIEPVTAPTEMLTCKRCGKTYASSGKHDKGYCLDCVNTLNVIFKGGMYDGMRNSGLLSEE